jgi:hypothetical protein
VNEGRHAQWFAVVHACIALQLPQSGTILELPQLSFAVTAPHIAPSREQNAVSVSLVHSLQVPVVALHPKGHTTGESK